MAEKKIALLVYACDRYKLLYKGFEFFFHKNWDFKVDCNYYFATENIETEVKGFKNICSGNGEWTERLRHLLTNKIEEEYILLFQEDMWLKDKADTFLLNEILQYAIANNLQQLKLHSSPVYKTRPSNNYIDGFNLAEINNADSFYLMSHQVSLWKKDFLLQQLQQNENAWKNEENGSKNLKQLNALIIQADYFSENGAAPNNKNTGAAKPVEYFTVSSNALLNKTVEKYIDDLKAAGQEEKEYAAILENNYINNITHDGKERPLVLTGQEKAKQKLMIFLKKAAPGLVKTLVKFKSRLAK